MFEKLSLINAIGEKIGRLSAGTVLLRHVENADEMVPFGQRIGLEELEQPPGIAEIAVTFLQYEINCCFACALPFTREPQFRGDKGWHKGKAGPKAHAILLSSRDRRGLDPSA